MSFILKNLLVIIILVSFTEHYSGNNFVQAGLKKNKKSKEMSSPKRPDDIHP